MHSEFESVELLHTAILQTCPSGCFVGIEGHSTSGKTTLGKALAHASGGRLVSTDKYARQRRPGDTYATLIDVDGLRRDLDTLASAQGILIEGICLRDVAERCELQPAVFIYVKRISAAGLWVDDPENHTTDGKPNSDLNWVDRESVLYHLTQSPLERADYIYVYRER